MNRWSCQPEQRLVKHPSRLSSLLLRIVFAWLSLNLVLTGFADPWSRCAFAQIVLGDNADDKLDDEIERSLRDTLVQNEQSVFIPTPREVLRPLLRADRAIREKEITRAVSLLGEVLSDSTSEDYLVPVTSSVEGLSTSLRLRAQGILGSLPRKDRDLYRLRYGVQAKQMLEKAIQEEDFNGVSQVMQRFFFTDAGFDAAMLLGHYHLDEGRPIAAANCFARITGSAEGRAIHDPEASVLLATCWMLGGSSSRAVEALKELKKMNSNNSIEFMGRPVNLFDDGEDALGWLQQLIGDSPLRDIEMVNQWVMSGGNPQRNARSGTGFPLITPRWSTVTLNDPDFEDSAIKRQRDLIYLKSAPIPSVQPLAVGNTIIMRAFDRMIGVDFKTGKRVWVFPPADFTANVNSIELDEKPKAIPKEAMTERMWLDSIYGQASSDGQRIFVVPEPGFSADAAAGATAKAEPFLQRRYNELIAVDIEREGAFVWEVGGATGLDEPKLAKSLFLGAPLPMGGELFAVCRNESEVLLVVLDAKTGKLNWSRRLGTTQTSLSLERDRHRRLAGATPSFADGIVVCSTGTGALVSVDISTRSLLWGYQYTAPGKKEVQPISPGRLSNFDPLAGLWRDSAITIADGKVLFTPVDSQDLVCVDLQSGFPGYQPSTGATSKSPRGDALFVACVENGLTILQAETNVRAISLETGNPVWKFELGKFGKPSGRGYANRGCYFFPTTSRHVVRVDLKTGKLVKAVRTERVLGNLVCHQGDVISHGVDRLSSYPQDEPNRELIESAVSKGELSHDQLAIQAQLQLQDGDLGGAIESIASAYKQTPNRKYESLLLDLILRMMESDFDFGLQLAQEYEDALIENRKYEYLTAKVGGLIRGEKYEASAKELFGLLEPLDQIKNLRNEFIEVSAKKYDSIEPQQAKLSELVTLRNDAHGSLDEKVSVRLDRWIASRISLIHRQSGDEQKSKLIKWINEIATKLAIANAGGLAESKSLQTYRLLQTFPLEMVDPEIRFKVLTELVADGNHYQANDLLASFETSESTTAKQFAAQSMALLAEHWLDSGLAARAVAVAERIDSRFGELIVSGEMTGTQFASSVKERAQPLLEMKTPVPTPRFNQVETKSGSVATANALSPNHVVLQTTDVEKYKAFQFRFFHQTGEFLIYDANGKQIHKFVARQEQQEEIDGYNQFTNGRVSIKNDLALVDIAREMFVFDLTKLESGQDPVLWYKGLPDGERDHSIGAVSDSWGEVELRSTSRGYEKRVFVSPARSDVICYVDAPHLYGVNARTGQKVWQRPSLLPGSVLLGNDEFIVAWNPTERVANFFSPADGRLVASRNLPADAGAVWQAYGTRVLVSNVRSVKSKPRDGDASKRAQSQDGRKQIWPKTKPGHVRIRTLGLFDLLSGKMVWERQVPIAEGRAIRSTIACRIGQDRIAILPPEGDLQFLDVQTGNVAFSTPVKLDRADRQDVDGIGVAVKSGKYLVHLKRGYCPTRTSIEELDVGFLYVNYAELTWFGTLICVDSNTGEDLWKNHVRFDYLQIGQGTPFNSPIYTFLRRFNNNTSVGTNSQTQVIGINLENGEQVFNSLIEPMPGYQSVYKFTNDPESQQLILEYDGYQATFKMSHDDDVPPRPVAHLRKLNSIPSSFVAKELYKLDTDLIKAKQKQVLQKAIEAQKLLSKKRAEEKRLLEAERDSKQ